MSKKPVVLMILDGYGLNDNTKGNGIAAANTPVMDKLMYCISGTDKYHKSNRRW